MFRNKTILITGGTGSLGYALTDLILKKHPKKLIILSRNEHKQVEMERVYPKGKHPIRYIIGDIRDRDCLYRSFSGVDYVINAAALKHVDKCEYSPIECIKTNINGAVNIIDAAVDRGVKKVLAVSTDKAVNPVNIYGAAKLCGDVSFTHANVYSKDTRFAVVRFGNFIGSSGSVIPYFQDLKKRGVPIPITDERMTRFFISIENVAKFCLKVLGKMKGGEIFIPKMPAVKIVDLAKQIYPGGKIEIVGIRDGEKLHEDLIVPDHGHRTYDKGKYFVTYPHKISRKRGLVGGGFRYSSEEHAREEKLNGIY